MNKFLKFAISVLSFSPVAVNAAIKNVDFEKQNWQTAQQENTASAYTNYLLEYPVGEYSEQAYQALDQNTGKVTSQESPVDSRAEELMVDPDNLMIVV